MEGFTPAEERLRVANGLEQLARLIRYEPGIRINQDSAEWFTYSAASETEVEAIADALCVPAEWNQARTHYRAVFTVNERVAYAAVYVTPGSRAAFQAAVSYAGCVAPELAATA